MLLEAGHRDAWIKFYPFFQFESTSVSIMITFTSKLCLIVKLNLKCCVSVFVCPELIQNEYFQMY